MFKAFGKQFDVFAVHGEVVEVIKDSETVVSGSGGGGHIHTTSDGHGGGHISNISIKSATVKRTIIWIKTKDNKEVDFLFDKDYADMATRNGHSVTFVCFGDLDSNRLIVISMINHTTNNTISFTTPKEILQKYHCPPSINFKDFGGLKILKTIKLFFFGTIIFFCIEMFGALVICDRDCHLYSPHRDLIEGTVAIVGLFLSLIPLSRYLLKCKKRMNTEDAELKLRISKMNIEFTKACTDLDEEIKAAISKATGH